MKHFWILILVFSVFSCKESTPDKPYLSNLTADKGDPLYTTYAAAMQRSEFVLDEGYEFRFYEPSEGIDFITDTSGELGVGFIINGEYIYKESQMYKAPVISTSYPDMVRYSYYPVNGIRVNADFLVQSSHVALWDLEIFNETGNRVEIEVIPFLRNNYRDYNNVNGNNQDFFSFTHESFPDGWTVSHEVPYEQKVQNIFLFSEPGSEKGVFNSLMGETPEIPFLVQLDQKSVYQISGRALKTNNERLIDKPPYVRMQVALDEDKNVILTENSQLLGVAQPSIDHQGYFRMELGHLPKLEKASNFNFIFYDEKNNLAGTFSGTVKDLPGNQRQDVKLEPYNLPAVPKNVKAEKIENRLEISWEMEPGLVYHVFRRVYPGATYEKVASDLQSNSFEAATGSGMEGFVVVAEDPHTGKTGMHSREVNNSDVVAFKDFTNEANSIDSISISEHAKILAFKKKLKLEPKEKTSLRMVRAVGKMDEPIAEIEEKARKMLSEDVEVYQRENEQLFSQIPVLTFENPEKEMLYWSSFNMMRQVFYPAEGLSNYNYYVFSREPTWGWGHGGQVFHESITMLAYAYMDPESAMDSQRVYSERQYENGYINYRSGSYLNEIIEHEGQLTSSAPWYAWQNWEVYMITQDRDFLEEMYSSSKRFYNFYVTNRDSDQDGLAEWGGHAVLESVRDALVAVWDEVGWPANFEGVDLNSMLVSEAKALEAMALELGLEEEAEAWRKDHEKRTQLINDVFWDSETGFYYNADKKDNDFTFENENDLKREEIIGFLPLWAGIATPEQAELLVQKLTDPEKFWRPYGIPSLAADDTYYNDKGYWNGPVWVEWNFLIVQGLLKYGYEKEAKELVDRVAEGMIIQLKKNHNLWEFYSPDEAWAGYHKTYIWAGIINRMMMDVNKSN